MASLKRIDKLGRTMATFDFNSLNRPASAKRPINPIEIFRSAPALAETPNDLWQGQSKALEIWHAGRHLRDTLISLHTGAGKSIVGLLIAQSLINEGVSKVPIRVECAKPRGHRRKTTAADLAARPSRPGKPSPRADNLICSLGIWGYLLL
jgi:hypothetical protein